ncbi:hypothetical protein ACHHYP_09580 [Achlya hypogyna]|uniref:Uncharacterized protein n=1 Tax=Achlya hypogyna TaxID=1202772 RepID=A0A1V9YMX1_ACHHY|nr:hypothetical protein ACHHYP_09580 [Achlya hypogyna]
MSARITKQILRATVLADEPAPGAKKTTSKGSAVSKGKASTKPLPKRRRFLEEARLERTKADNTAKNVAVLKKLAKTPKSQDIMKKILQHAQRL